MNQLSRLSVALTSVLLCVAFTVPALGQNVEIIRDEYGVPHVYGDSLASTWYGVGYASGQDRLWQADVLRRLGTGTSAEYFGASAVAGDVTAHAVFGPASRRAALFAAASPRLQTVFRAYAAGMNAWIKKATKTGQLPVEYGGLGLPPPRKWTVDDSIAVTMALLQNFGESGADELDHLADLDSFVTRLGATEGGKVFFDTHIPNDPTAPTSIPASGSVPRTATYDPVSALESLPSFDAQVAAKRWNRAWRGWQRNALRAGLKKSPASNAIAIAPKLSADGAPLLLHGPQMGYTVPQVNHEMGIHGGGYDVTGMIIAGIPGIPIGITPKHAWTLTTGGTDNNDIYLETLNPDNPAQYQFGRGFRNMNCRRVTINVRGGDAVGQTLCETVHGPVLVQQSGIAFTLKTGTRGYELTSVEGMHRMMTAKNIRQFDRGLSKAAYNFNVLYVDVKGNIAYWHAGKIPVRAAGDSPWFPHIGAGIAEWQGFIPWKAMPHIKNPSQGWLTSWNNKPRVNWSNSTRGFWQWGPVARVNTLMNGLRQIPPGAASVQLVERLNLLGGWTTDTPSGNASTVVVSTVFTDLLGHVDADADPRIAEVMGIFAGWDGMQLDLNTNGRYDSPAVAIFNTWWQALVDRVFADELGSRMERNVVANMVGRMVKPGLIPLQHDYLDGESVGEAVTGALIDALDALTGQYGSNNPADWLQKIAVIDWDPIGAIDVPDIPWMNRGTYNQITHMGRGANLFAQNVIAPGQSGSPLSPHFADQLLNYATWAYKVMHLTRESLEGNTESTVQLKAPNIKTSAKRRGKKK